MQNPFPEFISKLPTYKKGQSYFIPAGKKHQITLHAGYAEMDYTLDAE